LWWSRSGEDGASWTEAAPLPINSASEDYNPRLVRAEDGTLWLYWISTRRGLGWELWASSSKDGRSWSDPQRVPLEQFVAPPAPPSRSASLGQRLAEQLPASIRDRWPVGQVAQAAEDRGAGPAVAPNRPLTELLEYDVIQDRRGRWLVGFYSRDTREMVF